MLPADTQTTYDAIILGAGAAGLMCAAAAGQRGRRVLLADHADRPGKKILISGGGRCNFTNIGAGPDNFLSENPHFARSALNRYTPADFLALVEAHNIAWHEKTLGQLFCDRSARQIVDMLLAECAKARAAGGDVRLLLGQSVSEIAHGDDLFRVRLDHETAIAQSLVIATGGPSIPKMGATGFAYDVARQFALAIVQPRPALVPFTLDPANRQFDALPGIAADVIARCNGAAFREAFLITHKGLSGPAILQVSSYWRTGDAITIDFAPDHAPGWLREAKRARPKAGLAAAVADIVPARLAQAIADELGQDLGLAEALANVSDRTLTAAEERLGSWTFHPNGTEGYAKAEVTAGGVSTDQLSQKTLEARRVPGLHFIGEAVDVTGWLGGYNFQWAWASGVATGAALRKR